MKKLLFLLLVTLSGLLAEANSFSGKVLDKSTNDPLPGALIIIQNTKYKALSDGDGSFNFQNIPKGNYTVVVTYISFAKQIFTITVGDVPVVKNIYMESDVSNLKGVSVVARKLAESESAARLEEKKSDNVINVVSSKAIELSPDIMVANVVQRVSGLTVERNSNGDGQYAIVRGMDKRYNYTLVNGIKIPSPDNENRYVPLDIFPSELLSRLVVSKSLTPDMEGDAIGGVVDMKLKEAPSEKLFKISMATGYNEAFLNKKFNKFDTRSLSKVPPREDFGKIIKAEDLTTKNFDNKAVTPLPNQMLSAVWGDRYFGKKLGFLVAGSFQNSFRSADRIEFGVSDNNRGQVLPQVSEYQERDYSIQQKRGGIFNKIDYVLNERHRLFLNLAYMRLQNNETRFIFKDELRGGVNPTQEYNIRNQINIQQIANATLQGEHKLTSNVKADWSLAYSKAQQEIPDNSILRLVRNYDLEQPRWIVDENFTRIWEGNSDEDVSLYYNLAVDKSIAGQKFEMKYGGLGRIKQRANSYDLYSFKPNPGIQEYRPLETKFDELTWRTTGGSGTATHVLNYESYENILSQYLQFKLVRWNTQFMGGVRAEHTDQGFATKNPSFPEGNQTYLSILPSIHLKYMPNPKTNWRTSYFKSISRPSFLEIIPYRRPFSEEIFARAGNSSIKHAEAHNFDFRYEYFPKPTSQILVGGFYKIINNPIEYAVIPGNTPPNTQTRSALMPVNFQKAINTGLEMDYTYFFSNFGVKCNYTLTFSRIESLKRAWGEVTADNINQISDLQQQVDGIKIGDSTFISVTQVRPLQGQSMHLGNLSLLYKNEKAGIDAQLAMVYTGERIAFVAVGLDNDIWQKSFTQLDFSLDYTFGNKKQFVLFSKINNILNSPFIMVMKKPHIPGILVDPLQPNSDKETLMRSDLYNRNYLFGFRYKL